MTLEQVLPHVTSLTRSEKLILIQTVAQELMRDGSENALLPNRSYPIWSPHRAFDAAKSMMEALEAEESR